MERKSTNGRRATQSEREWETCVADCKPPPHYPCDNRVARFERGDFYCQKHAPSRQSLNTKNEVNKDA